jgi:AcrR family transcriptional regulator
LAAARQVFDKKGFAEATLDDVIALSGGSRQTLYALFGKQGLFEAIISDNRETIFQGLTPEKVATLATDEVLKEVGTRYLAIVTSPSCLSLNRLVIAEVRAPSSRTGLGKPQHFSNGNRVGEQMSDAQGPLRPI